MVEDNFSLKGRVYIELNGKIVQKIDNLVVTTGKTFVAGRMANASAGVMSHMAVGTNTSSAAIGNTTLGTESARVALTSATVSSASVIYVATFPAGTGTAALTEAGILNASSSGTLLCRTVFSVVNKAAADAMTITWTVTVS